MRMTRSGAGPAGRILFSIGWIVPALVLGFIAWDADSAVRHLLEVTSSYGVTVDPPMVEARAATGYEQGRRSIVLPDAAADGAHWVMQTQAMIAVGDWRVRHVDYDGAPRGRDVHWAGPFHWWLAALAWADHGATGRPLGISVERAALWSGPVMLALVTVGLAWWLGRKFSWLAAGLVALGTVAFYPFYIDFIAGRPDHHGMANLCCLATVLCLLTGSTDARPTRWFVASGVAGGVGLWISAATQVPVLIGVGLGFLVASWVGRREAGSVAWLKEPGLLRRWGWIGGATSFAAYLIEYFPGEMGFRLEVNHPLYALAWVGAGEVLSWAAAAMSGGATKRQFPKAGRARAVVGAWLVVMLPLTIALTAEKTFVVADPFVWRIHVASISEFQGLLRHFMTKGFSWSWAGMCLPMALAVLPVALVWRGPVSVETKALLVFAMVPALLGWLMGWNQVRWLSLAFALTVPVVAVCFRGLESPAGAKRGGALLWAAGCGALFLPGAVNAVQRTWSGAEFTREEIRSLATRDVAHWLKLRAGPERVVVASAPTATTKLLFFGGVAGLGTLYWENAAGLKSTAELFAAPTAEAAREMVRRLGVTHIVFFSWDAFEVALAKLQRGLPEDAPIPKDLFVVELLGAPVPPAWLRAVPFKLPNHPALAGQQIRVWEVVPEQSPAAVWAHAANYQLEMNGPDVAGRFAPQLEKFGDDLSAAVMRAGIAYGRRDGAAFTGAMESVRSHLAAADALALGDRISLVVVLAVAQQEELARAQLRAGLSKADERSVRHLSAGALGDLLALAEALGVEFPDPALKRLAGELLPPAKRK